MIKTKWLVAVLLVPTLLVSGCGKNGANNASDTSGNPANVTKKKDPVELTFYLYSMSPEDFETYYKKPIEAKFPYITATGIVPQKGQYISNLVAAGSIPDVIVGAKKSIEDTLLKYEMTTDLTSLIKKHNYDISKLNPALINSMKIQTGGVIAGLPLDESRNALYYNKDLFDKFGVAYPKDGMTWDEVYEIAKKMTRTEGGTLYRGYSERYHDIILYQNPFGLSTIDRNSEKGVVEDQAWKKVIENALRFYTIPGLQFDAKTAASENDKNVFSQGTSAMQIFPQSLSAAKFNWDIVSMPSYKEAPNVGSPVNAVYNFITNSSKHQDDAFDAIAYLTEEDRQLQADKDGMIPALKMNDTLLKAFKQNDPLFKGKNVKAFFGYQYGIEVPPRAQGLVIGLENKGISILAQSVVDVILGKKDENSALRDADEQITKALQDEAAKKK